MIWQHRASGVTMLLGYWIRDKDGKVLALVAAYQYRNDTHDALKLRAAEAMARHPGSHLVEYLIGDDYESDTDDAVAAVDTSGGRAD